MSSNIIFDMLSGAIQASFDPLAFVSSFLQNGSPRALAVGADAPQQKITAQEFGPTLSRSTPSILISTATLSD